MTDMLAKVKVVLIYILQRINISNQYVLHPKHKQCQLYLNKNAMNL